MNHARRDFLKTTAAALAAGALLGAATEPVLGLIFPPLNRPLPPEGV